jgi:hypothetical protein
VLEVDSFAGKRHQTPPEFEAFAGLLYIKALQHPHALAPVRGPSNKLGVKVSRAEGKGCVCVCCVLYWYKWGLSIPPSEFTPQSPGLYVPSHIITHMCRGTAGSSTSSLFTSLPKASGP